MGWFNAVTQSHGPQRTLGTCNFNAWVRRGNGHARDFFCLFFLSILLASFGNLLKSVAVIWWAADCLQGFDPNATFATGLSITLSEFSSCNFTDAQRRGDVQPNVGSVLRPVMFFETVT